jgi:hypothetical protein
VERIKALKTTDHRKIDKVNIETKFVNQYKLVFKSDDMKKERKVTMQRSISIVPRTLTQEQQQACKLGLSLDELTTALKEMLDDKSPS